MNRPDFAEIRRRIAPFIRHTPVLDITDAGRGDIVLKLDTLQTTGSFKIRGAANAILTQPAPLRGVIAASGGNHGASVAYVAARLGISADIFVPKTVSTTKLDMLHAYGARIHRHGEVIGDAFEAAKAHVVQTGLPFIHGYDAPEVVAGQATCALEFIEQAMFDTLLVAVGGGGLAAGCALALKPGQKLICVETDGTKTLHVGLAAGHPVHLDVSGIAKGSLGPPQIGAYPFEILKDAHVASLVVSDDDVRAAQRFLWDNTRLVAEPGGITAFAALTSGAYKPAPGERVGVILSGGNCEPGSVLQ